MRKASLIILLVLFCCVLYTGSLVFKKPLLRVAFLAIGQGDAVLVVSPSGNTMLIDGGPDKSILTALGSVLPFYSRSIGLVLATSQKSSAIGGLSPVLDRFTVGAFVDAGLVPTTAASRSLLDQVSSRHIPHIAAAIGEDIDLGDGVRFSVLSSGAEITGRLSYGLASFSIPADIPATSTDAVVFESDGRSVWRK